MYGQAPDRAVVAEIERQGAERIFVVSTRSLARLADGPMRRVERALGQAHIGTFATVRTHSPREDVVASANAARDARASSRTVRHVRTSRPRVPRSWDCACSQSLRAVKVNSADLEARRAKSATSTSISRRLHGAASTMDPYERIHAPYAAPRMCCRFWSWLGRSMSSDEATDTLQRWCTGKLARRIAAA